MEVNAIFANTVPIDEKNNFRVDFKNENDIIELLLNRKKDYYLTNSVAFIENKKTYSQEIKDLEKIAKEHLLVERNSNFSTMVNLSIQLHYVTNSYLFDRKNLPFWVYTLNEEDMKKYKKKI